MHRPTPDTAALRARCVEDDHWVSQVQAPCSEAELLDLLDWIDAQPVRGDGPSGHAARLRHDASIVEHDADLPTIAAGMRAAADTLDAGGDGLCPYIVTGGEGTSYCSLAESGRGNGPGIEELPEWRAFVDAYERNDDELHAFAHELIRAAAAPPAPGPGIEELAASDQWVCFDPEVLCSEHDPHPGCRFVDRHPEGISR